MMTKNVGGVDRIARIVIGLLLITLALTDTIGAWGWVGVMPLATGLMSNCLFYRLIGVNTHKKADAE